MSIFKCKMCGGELQINPGESVAVCEYCGTTQTLPKLDDDRRANLYDRANHFRRNNDFDKAAGIYEQILNEDKTDAEAYWSLVLCRYYDATPQAKHYKKLELLKVLEPAIKAASEGITTAAFEFAQKELL